MTGAHLHLVEPLGFSLDDAKLRRAGLDYHDLAIVTVHPTLDHLWFSSTPRTGLRIHRFRLTCYADISYRAGDVLMFGPETTGLDQRCSPTRM